MARALPRPGPEGPLAFDSSGRPLAAPSDPVVALALRGSVPDDFARKLLRDLGAAEALACLRALNRDAAADAPGERRPGHARGGARGAGRGGDRRRGRGGALVAPGRGPRQPLRQRAAPDGPGRGAGRVEPAGGGGVPARRGEAVARPLRGERGEGARARRPGGRGHRLGLERAPPRRAAAPRPPRRGRDPVSREAPSGEFDGVLVDAPCSGSGALCREPDARWRIDDAAVARFQETQGEVLRLGAGLVRSRRRAGLRHLLDLPGGRGGGRRPVPGRESGIPARGRGAALAPPRTRAQASTWRGSSGAPRGGEPA